MSVVLDWVSRTPVTPLDLEGSFIELPAFSHTLELDVVDSTWHGASELITQFNYSASKNFVIPDLPEKPFEANYVLCIRYRIDQTVFRYKLWDDDASILGATLYDGEIIKKNFVLEVWSLKSPYSDKLAQSPVEQGEPIQIPLSIRRIVTDFSRTPSEYLDASGFEQIPAGASLGRDFLTTWTPNDVIVNPSVNGPTNPAYFNPPASGGSVYPAGTYNVQYIQGAINRIGSGWMVTNLGESFSDGVLCITNGLPPGINFLFPDAIFTLNEGNYIIDRLYRNSQADAEAAWSNTVATITLSVPGKIGMWYASAPPSWAYQEGSPNPTFRLAPAFALPLNVGTGGMWLDNVGPRTPTFHPQTRLPVPTGSSGPPPAPVDPNQLINPEGQSMLDPQGNPIIPPPA